MRGDGFPQFDGLDAVIHLQREVVQELRGPEDALSGQLRHLCARLGRVWAGSHRVSGVQLVVLVNYGLTECRGLGCEREVVLVEGLGI